MLNIEEKIREAIKEDAQGLVDYHLVERIEWYHKEDGYVDFDECVSQIEMEISPDHGFYTYYREQHVLIQERLELSYLEFYAIVSVMWAYSEGEPWTPKPAIETEYDFRDEGMNIYFALVRDKFHELAHEQEGWLMPEDDDEELEDEEEDEEGGEKEGKDD